MEFPFGTNPRGFPFGHGHQDLPPRSRTATEKHNVVRIPITGPDGEEAGKMKQRRRQKKPATARPSNLLRTAAAVMIQRLWRGFSARKSVRALSRISAEVGEVERTIRAREGAIRRDPRERQRADEMLMAVLLRLDNVRWARDYRKKVIRRVISLQDLVDSIAARTLEEPEMVHAFDLLDLREKMAKMIAENERLERLVVALRERSTEHCQLMTGLVDRVEHLEQEMQRMEMEESHANSAPSEMAEERCTFVLSSCSSHLLQPHFNHSLASIFLLYSFVNACKRLPKISF
ncbi:BAG domain [Musa troglodytarum]|uniref:BAG domain n=1 Tax=Musa troglodytarum TaxID=320322 RepID=A0A9E7HEE0_9LILI|nr:BAG domain [Musa troglodytarum]